MIATRLSSRWRAITPSQAPRSRGAVEGRGRAGSDIGVPRSARRSSSGSASRLPVAAIITRSSVAVRARDLGRHPALVEDEDPVGHRDDLGQVARDEDDPEAGRGQLGDDPVDLDLGPDVDAAGRLVEDQQPRLRGQPLGQDDLLLVAARQGADHLLDAGHLHVELLGVVVGDGPLRRAVDQEPREEPRQDRQRHVLGDREVQHQAFLVAVLGQVGDAGGHRGGRAGEGDPLPVQRHRAGVRLVDPEQDPGDLRAAGADEPGEAEDLALADRRS